MEFSVVKIWHFEDKKPRCMSGNFYISIKRAFEVYRIVCDHTILSLHYVPNKQCEFESQLWWNAVVKIAKFKKMESCDSALGP